MVDVVEITRNILENYNIYTRKLLHCLQGMNAALVCKRTLQTCISSRETYSCSVKIWNNRKWKYLDNVWPIMIGSRLDVAIRKRNAVVIETLDDNDLHEWSTADIAVTLFLVKGILKMLPTFITNDPTNVHVQKNTIVKIYRYNAEEKGTELSLYMNDDGDGWRRGEIYARLHSGTVERIDESDHRFLAEFFRCPIETPIHVKKLFQFVYNENFDIDHLGNKTVLTPGGIFYKLFRKVLFVTFGEQWKEVLKAQKIVSRSIDTGDLTHVISKKTVFYKESHMQNKMNLGPTSSEPRKELGMDHQVFADKKTVCYRDVHLQCYQLIPYLSQTAYFQISSKVKSNSVLCYNDSYVGFLCPFGTTETKNVGRQMLFSRNVWASTEDDTSEIYKHFAIDATNDGSCYVVVNSACIPVSRSYDRLDLLALKRRFGFVECYVKKKFLFVNYKPGMLFKRLSDDLYVTPNDMDYWLSSRVSNGFDFITSHYSSLVPHFNHNAFPKNVLALNALKNAILSETPEYSMYFRETVSAYAAAAGNRVVVKEPADEFSAHWVIRIPKLNVMFASFRGLTQEDCVVVKETDVFDSYKLSTIKFRVGNCYFRPAVSTGDTREKSFLGTITCHDKNWTEVQPQTMHTTIEMVSDRVANAFFTKSGYKVIDSHKYGTNLFITVQKYHACDDGDKLCSLAGQKGVLHKSAELPRCESDDSVMVPDLVVNPYSLIGRQTMGQVLEMIEAGGRDYDRVFNPNGKLLRGSTAFVGPAFYFPINYHADEHIYVATNCIRDKITGQPVRGRSRQGGMKAGTMEINNGFRGNGLSSCYEEKLTEHSDRMITARGVAIPKSVFLCREDAKIYKCTIDFKTKPLITQIKEDETSQNERKRSKKKMQV